MKKSIEWFRNRVGEMIYRHESHLKGMFVLLKTKQMAKICYDYERKGIFEYSDKAVFSPNQKLDALNLWLQLVEIPRLSEYYGYTAQDAMRDAKSFGFLLYKPESKYCSFNEFLIRYEEAMKQRAMWEERYENGEDVVDEDTIARQYPLHPAECFIKPIYPAP